MYSGDMCLTRTYGGHVSQENFIVGNLMSLVIIEIENKLYNNKLNNKKNIC